MVKVAKEIKLKEKKENNIIITGLPRVKISTDTKTIDTESEKAILKEILDVLSVEDSTVKRFSRIKTKENMNDEFNPMIVEFNDNLNKVKAIRNSSKLKTYEKHKVFINNDLTESERSVEKNLRDERNRLNGQLNATNSDGQKYGEDSNGKKFHYGIRYGSIRKIYHQ